MSISDQIHNYYEQKVVDVVQELGAEKGYSSEQMVDLACLALNHLPTRYFRHEVDLAFYMSAHEHDEINQKVRVAVYDAIDFIETHKANS